jgi:hypothetical protein
LKPHCTRSLADSAFQSSPNVSTSGLTSCLGRGLRSQLFWCLPQIFHTVAPSIICIANSTLPQFLRLAHYTELFTEVSSYPTLSSSSKAANPSTMASVCINPAFPGSCLRVHPDDTVRQDVGSVSHLQSCSVLYMLQGFITRTHLSITGSGHCPLLLLKPKSTEAILFAVKAHSCPPGPSTPEKHGMQRSNAVRRL